MRSNSFPRRGWSRLWTILALLPILGGVLWVAIAQSREHIKSIRGTAKGVTSNLRGNS